MSSGVRWVSFPYRAKFADPSIEFANQMTGDVSAYQCEAERHRLAARHAAYLEVFYSSSGEVTTVHRAWFTCSGCHAKLEASYEPDLD